MGVEGQIFTFFFFLVFWDYMFSFFPFFVPSGIFSRTLSVYGSRPNLTTDCTVVECI